MATIFRVSVRTLRALRCLNCHGPADWMDLDPFLGPCLQPCVWPCAIFHLSGYPGWPLDLAHCWGHQWTPPGSAPAGWCQVGEGTSHAGVTPSSPSLGAFMSYGSKSVTNCFQSDCANLFFQEHSLSQHPDKPQPCLTSHQSISHEAINTEQIVPE